MTEREVGEVKWFSKERRYGFIQRRNGKPDAFLHFDAFKSRQDAYWINDGDSLEFAVEITEKGPRAVDVQVV
jgi:CspA family cold shock protein